MATNGASSIIALNGGTLNNIATLFSNGSALVVGGDAGSGAVLNLLYGQHWFYDGLIVGNGGASNQLNVSGGGWVAASNLVIGASDGAADNAVLLSSGVLQVSDGTGGGALDVRRGSFTLNSGTATVERLLATNGAASLVNLNGGQLETAGSIVSNGVIFIVGDGTNSATLNLLGGSHNFANGLIISSNAMLAGAGTLLPGGVTLTNFGTIAVGALAQVPGGLTNVADLVQVAGSALEFGVGRRLGLDCGFLQVLGSATLDGQLDVTLRPYYLDAGGLIDATDVFTVLTANVPLAGVFSNVASGARLDSIERLGSFLVNYSGSNVILSDFQAEAELGLLIVTNYYLTNILLAGNLAPNNRLIVTNGGVLESTLGIFGRTATSSNNTALVTGAGSVWTNAEALRIGSFGPGNQMTVANSGQVSSAEGTVGWAAESSNNAVVVTGGGSAWTNANGLFAGLNGSLNQLTISDGGLVGARSGYVGYARSATNNVLAVSGPGSLWTNFYYVNVGYSGSFNQVTINNAGRVATQTGYVGYASSASNNAVVVSDTGSVWRNSAYLYVGYSGSGNTLTVTNGGRMSDSYSYVGYNASAGSNAVLVTGAGSVWTNSGDIYLGNSGSGNQLTVANGGGVLNNDSFIGYNVGADNNAALVTGAGSFWTNSGYLYVGYSGTNNTLTVADGGQMFNVRGHIGNNASASNCTVLVTGAGSTWVNTENLYVGNLGPSNTLTVANGGQLLNVRGHIGQTTSSSNNTVWVTGAGSAWANSENLYVGNVSLGNTLTIADGGQVLNIYGYIGNNSSASNNAVLVTGAGSVWTNNIDLYIGNSGSDNQLTISNGGRVVNIRGFISDDAIASNNAVLVAGAGSVWNNSGNLYVGNSGSSNNLTIANGGQVFDAAGYIGNNSSSTNNQVLVTDAGTIWSNSSSLYVGYSGVSNNLAITNGGAVWARNIVIGSQAGSTGSSITLDGGRLVTTDGSLEVRRGSFTLNSGTATVTSLYVTNGASSVVNLNGGTLNSDSTLASNGSVFVVGSGGSSGAILNLLKDRHSFYDGLIVGNTGASNQLSISGGAWLTTSNLVIGALDGAADNTVLLSNGNVQASDGAGGGVLDVRRGSFTLNNGTATVDRLVLTNGTAGVFNLNGGRLNTAGSTVSNSLIFTVGDGVRSATLNLSGGSHNFANGLVISSNSVLAGGGILSANGITMTNFGTVAVGALDQAHDGLTNIGNLAQAAGSALNFGIGGRQQGADYGFLRVQGSVALTGRLDVTLSPLYLELGGWLDATDLFTVLTADAPFAGAFTNVASGARVSSAEQFASFAVNYSDSNLVLSDFQNASELGLLVVSNYYTTNGLLVGSIAANNQLIVTNGGVLDSTLAVLGRTSTSSNNAALVTGSGSVWNDAGVLRIGNFGSSNQLTVTNGGQVFSSEGALGWQTGAFNNVAVVTGSGSVWSNNTALTVGYSGASNQLTISDGGSVFAAVVTIGANASALSNSISMAGGSLVVTSSTNGPGALDVLRGRLDINGGTVTVAHLYATNAGGRINFNGGTLNSADTFITNGYAFIVGDTGNAATLNLAGGRHAFNNGQAIGNNGAGNRMAITDGGLVFNNASVASVVGSNTTASNNQVLVSGVGSLWSNRSTLYIGYSGASNQLTVTNGGRVLDTSGYVGYSASASNNSVLVAAPSSAWSNSSTLYIGYSGPGNSLSIQNGGRVFNTFGYMGYNASASNNAVLVTGADSVWSNNSDLNVGYSGLGNSLVIANGGQVFSTFGFMGYNASSSNNAVLVTGAGSLWRNSASLYVSDEDNSGNNLTISNSGRVFSSGGYVGCYFISSSNNWAVVTGAGSVWSNSFALFVGPGGSSNSLAIVNSGQVFSDGGYIGDSGSASNNSVQIAGAGSVWNNSGALYAGDGGASNSLMIADGGRVFNSTGYVGNGGSASNNWIGVYGSGSLWSNGSYLYLGNSGSFNRLTIGNGATVTAGNTIPIGNASSASNNTLTVTDAGTVLGGAGEIQVGNSGPSNTMNILNGATVTNSSWFQVGRSGGGKYNTLLVSGAGSLLSNAVNGLLIGNGGLGNLAVVTNGASAVTPMLMLGWGAAGISNTMIVAGAGSHLRATGSSITVGTNGAYNVLVIANGATVTNLGRTIVGGSAAATGNFLLVTDPGTWLTHAGEMRVGDYASRNTMVISNGASVLGAGLAYIGAVSGANSNSVLVTGLGSFWSNSSSLAVGNAGFSNSLTISDSGTVIASNVLVGTLASSTGNLLTVSGGFLYATNAAQDGTLDIRRGTLALNSGTVTVNQLLATNFADSVVSFNGGTLNSGGSTVDNGSVFQVGNGVSSATLHLNGGTHSFANNLFINTNASLTGTGVITGVITNAGTIAPGDSVGIITGSSGLTLLGNSLLSLELAGTNLSLLDRLVLGGLFTADGTLTVALQPGYTPQNGDVFDLFDYGSVAGSFDQVNLPTQRNYFWDLDHLLATPSDPLSGAILLTVLPLGLTNIIDGVVTNAGGVYILGDTTMFNDLIITNAGVLIDTSGIIGNQSTAHYNWATVTGAGSLWSNANDLYVGNAGSGNRLTITNGGTVLDANAYVGYETSASNNSVVVAGAGSTWSNAGVLTVGRGGSGNQVTLTEGAQVSASVLSNLNDSILSMSGGSTFFGRVYNSGTIAQGGGLFDPDFFDNTGLLQITNGTNIATVFLNQASGIVRQSGGEHDVNDATNFGSWTVSAGVANITNLIIESGGVFTNAGGTLVSTNAQREGMVDVRSGVFTFNGGAIEADRLYVTNNTATATNAIFNFNAGTLTTRSGSRIVAPNGSNFVIAATPGLTATWNIQGGTNLIQQVVGSASNTILGGVAGAVGIVNVSGGDTVWSNACNLWMGGVSSSNQMVITSGGTVTASNVFIGAESTSSNNLLTVSSGNLVVTNAAGTGTLDVRRGTLTLNSGTIVADQLLVTNTTASAVNSVFNFNAGTLTTRSGSQIVLPWASNFFVGTTPGQTATWNVLGGTNAVSWAGPSGSDVILGGAAGATGIMNVIGAGTVWSNNDLKVGIGGASAGNQLTITNGGRMATSYGFISRNAGSSNNSVLVAGSGSVWSVSDYLYVGFGGPGNQLTITNGGRLVCNYGIVGNGETFANNSILLADTGSVWSINTTLLMGSYSSGNQLTISNGGQLITSLAGYVGNNSSSSNNSVFVTGAGSVWSNANDLVIGNDGSGNRLTIANGGRVFGAGSRLGAYSVASVSNSVTVANAGSLWSNSSDLYVGYAGRGSWLTITNGGQVINVNGYIGHAAGANSNAVIVTGSGSLWTNSGNLYVGNTGAFNLLIVTNGGQVMSFTGYVGNAGSSNNSVLISGAGSRWNNRGDLYVGSQGNGNRLTINNGGVVSNLNASIGNYMASGFQYSNTVLVDGPGSMWIITGSMPLSRRGTGNGLTIRNGGVVTVATSLGVGTEAEGDKNFLTIDGPGSILNVGDTLEFGGFGSDNKLVITNGGALLSSFGQVGYENLGNNNAAVVTGSGSLWSNSSLVIGAFGSGNSMVISNGGTVVSGSSFLGMASGAKSNSVLVTGSGALWTNSAPLFIGMNGSYNEVIVTNNGRLYASDIFVGCTGSFNRLLVTAGGYVSSAVGYVGYYNSGPGPAGCNTATVTGVGSVWSNSGPMRVCVGSPNSTLEILNGGKVYCVDGVLSLTYGNGTNSTVFVSGTGSLWRCSGNLTIGYAGRSTLLVTTGGQVSAGSITFSGYGPPMTAWASGSNSLLRADNELYVGDTSPNAQMIITGGAQAISGSTYIGRAYGMSNSVKIVGPGSLWSNSSSLIIGDYRFSNMLMIADGGRVVNGSVTLGNSSGGSNNAAFVTGVGSFWSNSSSLIIGKATNSGNSLTISDGGAVWDAFGIIGASTNSDYNAALVNGTNSLWIHQANLIVGSNGAFNSLIVTNGGAVVNDIAYLGFGVSARNNTVTVTGPNSVWSNSSTLYVGSSGSSNSIAISNGADVFSTASYIGRFPQSSNNAVTVTGSGSVWSNASDLNVGNAGSGNSLTVSEGGAVVASNIIVGTTSTSTGNSVTISGGVLNGSLTIGNTGSFNQLTITNGGRVVSAKGVAGLGLAANSNSVLVSDANSLWTNSGDLCIGNTGSFNTLTIANGAQVLSSNVYIGSTSIASNNSVLVSDAGSILGVSAFYASGGNVTVGQYGSFNSLTIANGGWVTNRSFGIIGDSNTACNNNVLVTGVGSLWSNGAGPIIGNYGSLNNLRIANGGKVVALQAVIGNRVNASNNSVLVTDPGSLFLCTATGGPFGVGWSGFSNSMVVSNGGQVVSKGIVIGETTSASNNSLFVTGAGSLWSNVGGVLTVGWAGASNTMIVANGGRVISFAGRIGVKTEASNNSILVTGSGSVWENYGDLFVGSNGFGSQLSVTDGASIIASNVIVGVTTPSALNSIIISGGNLLVTNTAGDGTLDVRNGALALNSGTVVVNQFYATNFATSIVNINGGSLTAPLLINASQFTMTGGKLTASVMTNSGTLAQTGGNFDPDFFDNTGLLQITGGTNKNTVFLNEASGIVQQSGGQQDVNYATNFGTWLITTNAVANLTNFVSEDHGVLTVAGGTLNGSLTIGNTGSLNQLALTNGGTVLSPSAGYVGNAVSSSNNAGLVSGVGSLWSNSGNLYVGSSGSSNQLTIQSGGVVNSATGYIGYSSSADNNAVLVNGNGSIWSNSGWLYVGNSGSSNQLVIQNGGVVRNSSYGFIGGGGNSSKNAALVSGTGSVWQNSRLYVGYVGSFNQVAVRSGGVLSNGFGRLGFDASSSNNAVLVTGTGSLWMSSQLIVGLAGSSNQLSIQNGGTVFDQDGYIGNGSTASNNAVLVNGTGSLWTNSGNLYVGYSGASNSLTIGGSGQVINATGYVGNAASASNNTVSVTDPGSLWSNRSDLHVGYTGSFNRLTIANGGTVTASNVFIGANATSSNNLVTVSGGNLYATNAAQNGTLDIRRGALTLNSGTVTVNQLYVTNGASSVVNFNGGTLHSGGSTVDNSSIFQVGNGTSTATLHLMGGTHSFANGLFINTNATLTGTGAITGVITNAGSIAPGDSAGILTGNSNLILLANSQLQMELAGTNDWLFDQINIAGTLNFGGALTVSLINGFTPSAGNIFDLFDFTSGSGFFTSTNLPSLPAGLVWDTSLLYSSGEIETEQTPVLLAATSQKLHGSAGTFSLNLNLNPAANPTVEPRRYGPTQLFFTFNKDMMAADGTLDATEFTLTNATFVSASIVNSNLTLNLTNVVDQSKVTVVMSGLSDLAGNPLEGTNAVRIRSLYGDCSLSGTVSAPDLQYVKNRLLQAANASNFLGDLNCSGTISAPDLQAVKNNLLHTAPLGGIVAQTLLSAKSSVGTDKSVCPTTLGEALSAPELAWRTNGDDVWAPTLAPDGSAAAWSGSIGDLQVSWVETTVEGPGTITFQWKVSSEADADFLTFSIDGVDQPGRISGEVDWQAQTFSIPAGTHRLRWTYGKNGDKAAGMDAGWLRQVVYQEAQ